MISVWYKKLISLYSPSTLRRNVITVAQTSNLLSKYLLKNKRYNYQKNDKNFETMHSQDKFASNIGKTIINDEY